MSDLLDALNDEQRLAVEHFDGYVRLHAGAGTGKTRTLTYRYAYLVSVLGIPAKSVWCCTFTNKAASEMKSRIISLCGDVGEPFVSTFHSFCVAFLKQEIMAIGWPKHFTIWDVNSVKSALRPIYDECQIDGRTLPLKKAIEYIDSFKENFDYIPLFIAQDSSKLILKSDMALEDCDKIFWRYLFSQRTAYALDFDDLILMTLYILKNFPEIRARWQDRLEYIMVDEFQDIDRDQYELVEILAGKHHNLFIVGDPDQTIYSWRGARVEYFNDFIVRHGGIPQKIEPLAAEAAAMSLPVEASDTNSAVEKSRQDLPQDPALQNEPSLQPSQLQQHAQGMLNSPSSPKLGFGGRLAMDDDEDFANDAFSEAPASQTPPVSKVKSDLDLSYIEDQAARFAHKAQSNQVHDAAQSDVHSQFVEHSKSTLEAHVEAHIESQVEDKASYKAQASESYHATHTAQSSHALDMEGAADNAEQVSDMQVAETVEQSSQAYQASYASAVSQKYQATKSSSVSQEAQESKTSAVSQQSSTAWSTQSSQALHQSSQATKTKHRAQAAHVSHSDTETYNEIESQSEIEIHAKQGSYEANANLDYHADTRADGVYAEEQYTEYENETHTTIHTATTTRYKYATKSVTQSNTQVPDDGKEKARSTDMEYMECAGAVETGTDSRKAQDYHDVYNVQGDQAESSTLNTQDAHDVHGVQDTHAQNIQNAEVADIAENTEQEVKTKGKIKSKAKSKSKSKANAKDKGTIVSEKAAPSAGDKAVDNGDAGYTQETSVANTVDSQISENAVTSVTSKTTTTTTSQVSTKTTTTKQTTTTTKSKKSDKHAKYTKHGIDPNSLVTIDLSALDPSLVEKALRPEQLESTTNHGSVTSYALQQGGLNHSVNQSVNQLNQPINQRVNPQLSQLPNQQANQYPNQLLNQKLNQSSNFSSGQFVGQYKHQANQQDYSNQQDYPNQPNQQGYPNKQGYPDQSNHPNGLNQLAEQMSNQRAYPSAMPSMQTRSDQGSNLASNVSSNERTFSQQDYQGYGVDLGAANTPVSDLTSIRQVSPNQVLSQDGSMQEQGRASRTGRTGMQSPAYPQAKQRYDQVPSQKKAHEQPYSVAHTTQDALYQDYFMDSDYMPEPPSDFDDIPLDVLLQNAPEPYMGDLYQDVGGLDEVPAHPSLDKSTKGTKSTQASSLAQNKATQEQGALKSNKGVNQDRGDHQDREATPNQVIHQDIASLQDRGAYQVQDDKGQAHLSQVSQVSTGSTQDRAIEVNRTAKLNHDAHEMIAEKNAVDEAVVDKAVIGAGADIGSNQPQDSSTPLSAKNADQALFNQGKATSPKFIRAPYHDMYDEDYDGYDDEPEDPDEYAAYTDDDEQFGAGDMADGAVADSAGSNKSLSAQGGSNTEDTNLDEDAVAHHKQGLAHEIYVGSLKVDISSMLPPYLGEYASYVEQMLNGDNELSEGNGLDKTNDTNLSNGGLDYDPQKDFLLYSFKAQQGAQQSSQQGIHSDIHQEAQPNIYQDAQQGAGAVGSFNGFSKFAVFVSSLGTKDKQAHAQLKAMFPYLSGHALIDDLQGIVTPVKQPKSATSRLSAPAPRAPDLWFSSATKEADVDSKSLFTTGKPENTEYAAYVADGGQAKHAGNVRQIGNAGNVGNVGKANYARSWEKQEVDPRVHSAQSLPAEHQAEYQAEHKAEYQSMAESWAVAEGKAETELDFESAGKSRRVEVERPTRLSKTGLSAQEQLERLKRKMPQSSMAHHYQPSQQGYPFQQGYTSQPNYLSWQFSQSSQDEFENQETYDYSERSERSNYAERPKQRSAFDPVAQQKLKERMLQDAKKAKYQASLDQLHFSAATTDGDELFADSFPATAERESSKFSLDDTDSVRPLRKRTSQGQATGNFAYGVKRSSYGGKPAQGEQVDPKARLKETLNYRNVRKQFERSDIPLCKSDVLWGKDKDKED